MAINRVTGVGRFVV